MKIWTYFEEETLETFKKEIESRLGFEVGDMQLKESMHHAEKKLASIILRYGDADGRRREPDYLAQLVCEDIKAGIFSKATLLRAANMRSMEKERPADCRDTPVSIHIVAWKCK